MATHELLPEDVRDLIQLRLKKLYWRQPALNIFGKATFKKQKSSHASLSCLHHRP
jgi:hypothetical protein